MSTVLPNFPGPVGSKRRRMRSGGGVSTLTNNGPTGLPPGAMPLPDDSEPGIVSLAEADDVGEKPIQTSKCKGATTIPIFLKKTYKMIDTCDPSIASWTPEGDMFVVKDPDVFATRVIPQYFDHNKFSSFARQLNFYGFRKMQSKPIRNSDFDAGTAKHVTFFNENFKRGRCDLLKKIQRSTRGSGNAAGQDQAREIQSLRDQVSSLENKIQEMTVSTEERFRRLELDMLARIEQVMMTMQQQQQAQLRLQSAASVGTVNSNQNNNSNNNGQQQRQLSQQAGSSGGWETLQPPLPRNSSAAANAQSNGMQFPAQPQRQPMVQVSSSGSNGVGGLQGGQQLPGPLTGGAGGGSSMGGGPTLPPHPKQKQLPSVSLPGAMGAPPDRLNSLRGISALSRGLSGIPRGTSVESSASAVLMRNSWEDKFFSMLMLDEQNNPAAAAAAAANGQQQMQQQQQNPGEVMAPTPLAQNNNNNMVALGAGVPPNMVSERTMSGNNHSNGAVVKQQHEPPSSGGGGVNPADDLSSVSSSDIP